ncbi:hypothetical protein FB645_005860, partial [Coemansia sp. IMI 203386]
MPVIANPNDNVDIAAEWALSSPDLSQAQFFELTQQPVLAEAIMQPDTFGLDDYRLPVLLLGLGANEQAQTAYLSTVSSQYKVEISDPTENQPLSLNR